MGRTLEELLEQEKPEVVVMAKEMAASMLQDVNSSNNCITTSPVPVGRVYHSGCSYVSTKAGSLLFESSAEALLKRRKA